jgi:hypothetical protein
MATDSILGLFTTPEQYQQAQNEAALARGVQLAQLDPFQRASAQLYQGGYMAGGALGQALGAQDPMLQQLSTIKQLSSQFDTGTSGGLSAMANALREQGLIAPAFQIGQKAAELRKLEADAQAKTMERLTSEQKNAAASADAAGLQRGTTEWSQRYASELAKLTEKDTRTSDQKNFAAAKDAGYKGTFNQWLLEQNRSRATNISVPLSTVDKESNLRKDFTSETKPITTAITTGDRIEKLLTANTALGEIIARKQFAKLAGDTNISNRDVEQLANFGDLGQRLSGILSGFFEGKYSESQRQEALGLVRQLKAEGTGQYNTIQQQYRSRAQAENIPEKTATFIAPDLPIKTSAPLPPEGTRLRNKKTGKIEVVQGGKLVPVAE